MPYSVISDKTQLYKQSDTFGTQTAENYQPILIILYHIFINKVNEGRAVKRKIQGSLFGDTIQIYD